MSGRLSERYTFKQQERDKCRQGHEAAANQHEPTQPWVLHKAFVPGEHADKAQP